MRAILVDWLVQVHSKFRLLQETLYMCIAIMDRFLQVSACEHGGEASQWEAELWGSSEGKTGSQAGDATESQLLQWEVGQGWVSGLCCH